MWNLRRGLGSWLLGLRVLFGSFGLFLGVVSALGGVGRGVIMQDKSGVVRFFLGITCTWYKPELGIPEHDGFHP